MSSSRPVGRAATTSPAGARATAFAAPQEEESTRHGAGVTAERLGQPGRRWIRVRCRSVGASAVGLEASTCDRHLGRSWARSGLQAYCQATRYAGCASPSCTQSSGIRCRPQGPERLSFYSWHPGCRCLGYQADRGSPLTPLGRIGGPLDGQTSSDYCICSFCFAGGIDGLASGAVQTGLITASGL